MRSPRPSSSSLSHEGVYTRRKTERPEGDMFGWLKKKTPQEDDRAELMKEARELLYAIDHWDEAARVAFGVFLANYWRHFEIHYGTQERFVRIPRQQQIDYLMTLMKIVTRFSEEMIALHKKGAPKGQIIDA